MAEKKSPATKSDSPEVVDEKAIMTQLSSLERTGTKLIIPEGLALRDLLVMVKRMIADEEQEYVVHLDYDFILPEGMVAFDQAMSDVFGWSLGVTTQSFFGKNPPQKVSLEIGPNKTIQATFGPVATPGIDGQLVVGSYMKDGLPRMRLSVQVLNKQRNRIDLLNTRIRDLVKNNSIYRGQAIYLPVVEGDLDEHPPQDFFPRFLDLSEVNVNELVFSSETAAIIEDNVFGPIRNTQEFRNAGIPLKTGILMEGPYGCGKTLTALALAKTAVQNGWTFFLVKDARHLKTTLDFASNYQPAVVFCEDIDRVMEDTMGSRTESIDSILNTIDGIMAKSSEMMVVLTTNHVEKISKAMLRPGRLDVVVSITPPDAGAVEKLLRQYARGLIPVNEDLTKVCQRLEGQIPAMVREVVERSKRSAIAQGQKMVNGEIVIRAIDLERAAAGLMRHLELLKEQEIDLRSNMEKAADILVKNSIFDQDRLKKTLDVVEDLEMLATNTVDDLFEIRKEMERIRDEHATNINLIDTPRITESPEGEGV